MNAELVRQGYAQVATYPPDVARQELFVALQQEAREAEVGLRGDAVAAAITITGVGNAFMTMTILAEQPLKLFPFPAQILIPPAP